MHYYLEGHDEQESMEWELESNVNKDDDSVLVRYLWTFYPRVNWLGSSPPTRHEVLEHLKKALHDSGVAWLKPQHRTWIFDLDQLREEFPDLSNLDWFHGKISLEPDIEISESFYSIMERRHQPEFIKQMRGDNPLRYDTKVIFRIVPADVKSQVQILETPVEIQRSLERFKLDFPTPEKVAFIIMRFGATKAHADIEIGVKNALSVHGIEGVRADSKEYHDDLFNNLLTYMHGCGVAIAVYERIEEENFNPNISLEVGYMMALNKPVCILKDRTLKTLHSDIMGKLYRAFDPLDAVGTIPKELTPWLRDRGLVA